MLAKERIKLLVYERAVILIVAALFYYYYKEK